VEAEADVRKIGIVPETVPGLSVNAAPEALRLVIGNLLRNAVKFTPPNGRVTVRTLRQGIQAVLGVSDSGPGIVPEDLPRLFDRFYRASRSRSPDTPGVGLGLAIARAIVEAHGGTIAAESTPGAGATFIVRLPLAP
jgi:two-component system sensor histidine kinase BaeS